MSTEIVLSLVGVSQNKYGDPVVVPGQSISGTVTFHPQTQRDIKNITITLQGLCKTEGCVGDSISTANHRETIVLVRQIQPLFTGTYTIKAAKYDFPFDFVMPRESRHTRYEVEGNKEFSTGPSPLPPSLDHTNARPSSVIEYCLIVNVNGTRTSQSQTRVYVLKVTPLSLNLLPKPQPSLHAIPRNVWSSRLLRQEQHTVKQKFAHVLSGDPRFRTPRIAFDTSISCPCRASRAQCLPISIAIKQIITGSTDPKLPELVLDEICLKLEAVTLARVGWLNSETTGSDIETIDKITIPMHGKPLTLNGDSTQVHSLSINDIVGERFDVVPTFTSYTVSRRYVFALKAKIRHPGTDHVFKLKTRFHFVLLPEESTVNVRKTVRWSSPVASTPPQTQSTSSLSLLPAYESLQDDADARPPAYNTITA